MPLRANIKGILNYEENFQGIWNKGLTNSKEQFAIEY